MIETMFSPEAMSRLLPKLLTALIILTAGVVLSKLARAILGRWQTIIVNRLGRENPASRAALNTKMTITAKMVSAGVYFLALVLIFLQFEQLRNLGAGLLASAGVAGIVIGMAAQNTLSNLIAGISISFAQPVRLNDAVIFEGDFGWIEEISLMHTIIKTWDNRRIMIPNSVLSNKVIQNWTIKDSSLLGQVMLYVDYTCDVDQIKRWVTEIVAQSPNSTDERVAAVQVVDFTERTMALRILGKGPDAGRTWDLRCEIREKLLSRFREAGVALPVIRVSGDGPSLSPSRRVFKNQPEDKI